MESYFHSSLGGLSPSLLYGYKILWLCVAYCLVITSFSIDAAECQCFGEKISKIQKNPKKFQ